METALDKVRREFKRRAEQNVGFTHSFMHGSTFMSLTAARIRYPQNNPSTRNSYACNMLRNAPAECSCKSYERMDTISYKGMFVEAPLVITAYDDMAGQEHESNGHNVKVLVGVVFSDNPEDSFDMSNQYVQNGGFRMTSFHTCVCTEKNKKGVSKGVIGNHQPEDVVGRKAADYSHCDSDGIIYPGANSNSEVVLVNRAIMPKSRDLEQKAVDNSVKLRATQSGVVHKVMLTASDNDEKIVKVQTRKTHILDVGDKICSMEAQKGIVGHLVAAEDMPYTETGVRPDVMMNLHAWLSRMTWAQMFEMMLGSIAMALARVGDATGFDTSQVMARAQVLDHETPLPQCEEKRILAELRKTLHDAGLVQDLEYKMYSGITGEQLEGTFFMANARFLKLYHEVDNKIRARSQGQDNYMTKQPTARRAEDGGLRAGLMEMDCKRAWGAAWYHNSKVVNDSDPHFAYVCDRCNLMTDFWRDTETAFCLNCSDADSSSCCFWPYGKRLLNNQNKSMVTTCFAIAFDLF